MSQVEKIRDDYYQNQPKAKLAKKKSGSPKSKSSRNITPKGASKINFQLNYTEPTGKIKPIN